MPTYTSIEKTVMFVMTYIMAPTIIISLTPLGRLWELFTLHNPSFFKTKNSPEKHRKKVDSVRKQVFILFICWNLNAGQDSIVGTIACTNTFSANILTGQTMESRWSQESYVHCTAWLEKSLDSEISEKEHDSN